VRWEMRTRLFLRTTEFLWQEGHTAHASHDEAEAETLQMLGVYREFMEEYLAIPVITGQKSESEKFAGALRTYTCEAMMGDNKALQNGTSHNLGQNFAKQFALKFASESGGEEYAWNTSWGVSTRMVGGLVMTHGDDKGLVMPPRVAPIQVVIVPIYRKDEERERVMAKCREIVTALGGIRTHVDDRDKMTPGAKFFEWEMKGVPFRIEVGPKDMEKGQLVLARRIPEGEERKLFLPEAEVIGTLPRRLDEYQAFLYERAKARREANSHRGLDYAAFGELMDGAGGFVFAGWCGEAACEDRVKEETKATIRCLPAEEFRSTPAPATCMVCGGAAKHEAIWAKAY
jgi:prolyl-tRNA synthetase